MGLRVRLTNLGRWRDASSIEPSCKLLDILQESTVIKRGMIDCGALPRNFEDITSGYHAPDLTYLDDGIPINFVFVTHGHGDHLGYLPAVTPYLAKDAKIYMTTPVVADAEELLPEGILLKTKRGIKPPYYVNQYHEVLDPERLVAIDRPGEWEIGGLKTWVNPELHANGSASPTFRVGKANIHYSGDRCSFGQPGIEGDKYLRLPKGWGPHIIAGSDCTYGADHDSDKRTWKGEMDKGYDICADAVKRGHPVLLFAFRKHRSGALAHEMQRRGLPDLGTVVLDGGAMKFAKIANSPQGRWCELDRPLVIDRITEVRQADREELASSFGRGWAVISTPGMGGPGGIGTFWRRRVLRDPNGVVIFTGYVAPGTDGAQILAAYKKWQETGVEQTLTFLVEDRDTGELVKERIPLRCRVVQIRTGSHDSRGKIVQWFCGYKPQVAVLSHGSPAALGSLEEELVPQIPHVFRADKVRTIELDI